MRRLLPLALCLPAAAPAWAGCLAAADLDGGIAVAFSDGASAEVGQMANGLIWTDEPTPGEGPVFRTVAAFGLWEVEGFERGPGGHAAGSHMEVLYPEEPHDLPEPVPGLGWTGWTTPVFEGMVLRSDDVVVSVSEREPLVLDGCAYDAHAVEVAVERATDGPRTLRYVYLPVLGLALRLGREAEGEPPEEREVTALSRLP